MLFFTKKFRREQLALRVLRQDRASLSRQTSDDVFEKVLAAKREGFVGSPKFQMPHGALYWVKIFTASVGTAVLAFAGVAFASSGSNPGDTLYPVKLLQENFRLKITTNKQAKAKLQSSFAKERLNEYKKVLTKKTDPSLTVSTQQTVKSSVKTAIMNLRESEKQLKSEGRMDEAKNVRDTIEDLKEDAREQKVLDKDIE